MTAVSAMFLSVFFFSLYPLLASYGLENNDPVLFVMLAHFFCAVVSFLIGRTLFHRHFATLPKKRTAKQTADFAEIFFVGSKTWFYVFATGAAAAVAHSCFMLALLKTSKIGATIIYETWPILAIWITPFLVAKAWEKVRRSDYIFGLLALVGVAFIIAAENREALLQFDLKAAFEADPQRMQGYLLAFIGSLGIAVSTVMRAGVSQHFTQKYDGNVLLSAGISSGLTRMAALPFFVLIFLFFQSHGLAGFVLNDILLAVLVGIVVYTFGSLAYTYSFLNSKSPNIQVMYYIAPVLSIIWLQLSGFSQINDFIVIGTVFVLTANLLVTVKAEHSISYNATILTLLLVGGFCYFTTGLGFDGFYDAMSFTSVLYAILIAFAWDRVMRRDRHIEQITLDIAYGLDELQSRAKAKEKKPVAALAKHTEKIFSSGDKTVLAAAYAGLEKIRSEFDDATARGVFKNLDDLILSKTRGFMLSEIVVLAMIGGITVTALMVFRPDGHWEDMASVVMSAAVVFIFFAIFDQLKNCHTSPLQQKKGQRFYTLDSRIFSPANPFHLISVVLIVAMLAVFSALFAYKHGAFPL